MTNDNKEKFIADEEDERTPEEILRERFAAIFSDLDEAQLDEGLDALIKQYPEVDLTDLAADPFFAVFAKGRDADIAGIYEDFTAFYGAMEAQLSEKYRRRTDRSTSVGSARNTHSRAGLSDEQYGFLSDWNHEYPEYSMTAKEYMKSLKS